MKRLFLFPIKNCTIWISCFRALVTVLSESGVCAKLLNLTNLNFIAYLPWSRILQVLGVKMIMTICIRVCGLLVYSLLDLHPFKVNRDKFLLFTWIKLCKIDFLFIYLSWWVASDRTYFNIMIRIMKILLCILR